MGAFSTMMGIEHRRSRSILARPAAVKLPAAVNREAKSAAFPRAASRVQGRDMPQPRSARHAGSAGRKPHSTSACRVDAIRDAAAHRELESYFVQFVYRCSTRSAMSRDASPARHQPFWFSFDFYFERTKVFLYDILPLGDRMNEFAI